MSYLNLIQQKKIEPNFWCSEEYFARAGWVDYEDQNQIWMVDGEDATMLPPIDLGPDGIWGATYDGGIWADLPTYIPNFPAPHTRKTFLDFNFIYDPKQFVDMAGGKWATFRKNVRKFPKRCKAKALNYYQLPPDEPHHYDDWYASQLNEIVGDWGGGRKEIYDADVIISYLLNGLNREALVDEKGHIYGINVWDENYKYINFRYSICRTVPFLSEYMRWLFFTKRIDDGKLVNDGGALDNPELEKFKRKLNPIRVNTINSWKGV